jgi:hypothetical protein
MKGKDGGKFKQSEFVKIDPNDDYYLVYGHQICSPSYLSRLENNEVIAKVEVYNYLLNKLNACFIYRESNNKTQDYLCQLIVDLFFSACEDISRIQDEITKHSLNIRQDCLWELDLIAITSILNWFETGVSLELRQFHHLFEIFDCLNPKIQQVLLYYFVCSVYFNPSLWVSSKDVSNLVSMKVLNNNHLTAFQNFDRIQLFNLVKNNSNYSNPINNTSFLNKIILAFNELKKFDPIQGKKYTKEDLEYLMNRFRTSNRQFKKLIDRILSDSKYNHNDVRYLYQNFLVFEPSPHIFTRIIFRNALPKIKRTDQMKDFINWNAAII